MNNENERTPDTLRAELFKQLQEKTGTVQHLHEVAMPGVINPLHTDTSET